MRAYQTLVITLGRSMLREPVGLFFTLIFPPLLVAILGTIFGNDPTPQFDGKGFVDATLPAMSSLVVAIMGILILPATQLQLRESGALARLRAPASWPGSAGVSRSGPPPGLTLSGWESVLISPCCHAQPSPGPPPEGGNSAAGGCVRLHVRVLAGSGGVSKITVRPQ